MITHVERKRKNKNVKEVWKAVYVKNCAQSNKEGYSVYFKLLPLTEAPGAIYPMQTTN